MASNRQTRADRRNAQKSTGPRTPEGKAKTRFNALKYGIHADQIVLPTEDEDEWRTTFFNFHDEFEPRTPSQEALACGPRHPVPGPRLQRPRPRRPENTLRRDRPSDP